MRPNPLTNTGIAEVDKRYPLFILPKHLQEKVIDIKNSNKDKRKTNEEAVIEMLDNPAIYELSPEDKDNLNKVIEIQKERDRTDINFVLKTDPFKLCDLVKNKEIDNCTIFKNAVDNNLLVIEEEIDEETGQMKIKKIKGYDQKKLVSYLHRLFYPYFTFDDTLDCYKYNKDTGIYEPINIHRLVNFVYHLLPIKINKKNIETDLIPLFKSQELISRLKLTEKQDNTKICLKNNVLDVETFEELKFSPDMIFMSKINIAYNKNAICPNIDKFVSEVLPGKEAVFFELGGELLHPSNFLNKLHILYGAGANGKSVVIDFLGIFVGRENHTSAQLSDLAEDKHYCRSKLFNKKMCCYADISSRELNDLSFIKAVTGEDQLLARSPYGKPFDFFFGGSLIFSANEPPKIYEDTMAVWRRIHLITFDTTIKTENKKQRSVLMEELTTEQELSGMLLKSIDALKDLIKNKSFSDEIDEETSRANYLNASDTIYQFIQKYINYDVGFEEYETTANIYNKYLTFCREQRKVAVPENKFPSTFVKHTGSEKRTIRKEGKQIRAFLGVLMKDIPIEKENEKSSSKPVGNHTEAIKQAVTEGEEKDEEGCSVEYIIERVTELGYLNEEHTRKRVDELRGSGDIYEPVRTGKYKLNK